VLDASPGDVLFDVDMQSAGNSKKLFYARTHALKGDDDGARAWYESAADEARARLDDGVDKDPSALAALYLARAEALAGLERYESARDAARRAKDLFPSLPPRPQKAEWRMAYAIRVLLPLGDDEAALVELASYLGKPGAWSIEGLQRDPRVDQIRDHPHFAELVETYGRK
jgi:tetratricopeptide (TPR) repeat protein